MTTLISEIASSHAGNMDTARSLLDDIAIAQFDVAKFQSYQVKHLNPTDPQYGWLKKAEVSDENHRDLMKACASRGLTFLTTVFHEDRVPFLFDLGLGAIKIGSGEAMRVPLLEAVAAHPWTVYLSTGLATDAERDRAIAILGWDRTILMHTTSEYPTPVARANLGRLAFLREQTPCRVGYSDHTDSLHAAVYAMVMGAHAVEVHVRSPLRCRPWEKSKEDLCHLSWHRDTIAQMCPSRKDNSGGEHASTNRPFVGRWDWQG